MTSHTLEEIAIALGAPVVGDGSLTVSGAAEPASAGAGELAIAMDRKFVSGLCEGKAIAAVLWQDADWQSLGLKGAILVPRPRVAMSGLTRFFDSGPDIGDGIHASAVIDPTASLAGKPVVGPLVVIGARTVIGARARIAAHVTIGAGVTIGDDALILSGVRIQSGVHIGDGFIAQPGAVIGSDGFSFVTPEKSNSETAREDMGNQTDAKAQEYLRIHSLGGVDVGDNVEIGANSTVDRGTIRATRIGSGTKLDNLVQVGHNVVVGENCLLCGQSGVAGSTTIGNNVVIGGQVAVTDNIFVGDNVVLAGGTKVASNVPAGRVLMGYPAMKMETFVHSYKALRRLPRMQRQIAELQKQVSKENGDD